MKIDEIVGGNAWLRVDWLDDPLLVKVLESDSQGLWIESHELSRDLMYRRSLARDLVGRPILIPWLQIRYILADATDTAAAVSLRPGA